MNKEEFVNKAKIAFGWWWNADSDRSSEWCMIDSDGRVNEARMDKTARIISNSGVEIVRSLMFLCRGDNKHRFVLPQNGNYMPWYLGANGKYDLSKFNDVFFENLRVWGAICAKYNMRPCLALADNCHFPFKASPIKNNIQGVSTWVGFPPFYQALVDRVVETLKPFNPMFEIENEPAHDPSVYKDFFLKVISKLQGHGISLNSIFMGMEFHDPGNDWPGKRYFYDKLPPMFRRAAFSQMHQASVEKFEYMLYFDKKVEHMSFDEMLEACRLFGISDDGLDPKPRNAAEVKALFRRYMSECMVWAKVGHVFELCHAPYPGEVIELDRAKGLSELFHEFTGSFPVNYDRWKVDPEPEPVKPDPVKPDPKPEPVPEKKKESFWSLMKFKMKAPRWAGILIALVILAFGIWIG